MFSNKDLPRYALIIVGVASIYVAVRGIWFNWGTLFADYTSRLTTELIKTHDMSRFYPIFYIMSGICVTFYLVLIISGIQLIRKRTGWSFVLLGVVLGEFMYFMSVGALWANSTYNYTIGAATGISSGGLMYQVSTLFPVWAPLLALWAREKIIRQKTIAEQ
ncbi:MAG TPA: hypothetical protein VGH16_18635 [Candidatus Binatia bacterium]|jgi:hypothetical protein